MIQCGAITVLTKIMINCPDDLLFEKLEELTDKLAIIFRNKQF